MPGFSPDSFWLLLAAVGEWGSFRRFEWGGGRVKVRATLGLAVAGIAIAGWPVRSPAGDLELSSAAVRVLLYAGQGVVQVQRSAQSAMRVTFDPHGLRADGRLVGKHLRLEEGSPFGLFGKRYRGALEFVQRDSDFAVVNVVGLEEYVAGLLLREVYPGWDSEVLRAQAVVARTYALYQMRRHHGALYHLASGPYSQVYGGVDAEAPQAWRAVRDTQGEYLVYQGKPILAAYHSSSGGRTASAEEVWGEAVPYLVSVEVSDEEVSPDTYWRAVISGEELGRVLAAEGLTVGPVQEIEVVERSLSGRAQLVRIRGARGERQLAARELRRVLGTGRMKSTYFVVRHTGGDFAFAGTGSGHGVGMSQWGAQTLALQGATYQRILQRFYPGTRIQKLES